MDTEEKVFDLLRGAGLKQIIMPIGKFKAEHKNLLKVLKEGKPSALKKEYEEQKAELAQYVGKGTYREEFFKKYKVPEKSYSIKELSEISKVPIDILQQVYNRGVGAYKTQPKSVRLKNSFVKNVDAPMSAKLSKEQWAYARLYSFLMGNPKHDNDLRRNKSGGGKDDDNIREARRAIAASEAELNKLKKDIPKLKLDYSFLLSEVEWKRRQRRDGLLSDEQKRELKTNEKMLDELKKKIDEVEVIQMYIRSLEQAIQNKFF